MKKKIFALLLAAVLLCGCSADTPAEETAVLGTTSAEAAVPETIMADTAGEDSAAGDSIAAAEEARISVPKGDCNPGMEEIQGDLPQSADGAPADSEASPRRPAYDMGNCRTLAGDVFSVTLFVDDAESSWDEESIWRFWNEALLPGYDYLEREASERGIPLNFESSCYYTGMSEGLSVRYYGDAGDADSTTFRTDMDMLSQVLQTMGFASEADFRQHMEDFSGCQDVVVTIALNKPGRSYAWCNSMNYVEFFECCFIYSSYKSGEMDTYPCTVAHETLHLFGAEDYYDPYGDRPNRKQMADRMYPDDIMYEPYVNINYNEIGSFTEYTIGWRDNLPAECDTVLWWS